MTNEESPVNEESSLAASKCPQVTPKVLDFDEEGPIPTPEEQKQMLLNWREDQKAKGEEKENERGKKEAERLAKQREADRLRLQALRLQREEIELQEKALREALETKGPEIVDRRGKRVRYDQDGSSDSESYSRRTRSKAIYASDLEEEGSQMQDRIRRMEKAMFGERKVSHEPVVIEDVESYRPPPGRQFPKMYKFNGKCDPEDHCEKYESLMTGMGHYDVMLCKMFKTYLKGPAKSYARSQLKVMPEGLHGSQKYKLKSFSQIGRSQEMN